jgi:hypothetical protein
MATWKKVIVSGSTANLAALQVDNLTSGQVVIGGGTSNLSTTAINGTGNIVATTNATGLVHSGSFSGSFQGNFVGTTNLPDLTQGTGITAFTYDGSTTATVALKNAGSLTNNVLTKWDSGNGQLTNTSLTDNGTTITGASSIQLTGASSNLSGSFSGSFFGNGSGLTGVTATFPVTAKTDLATTDQFFINDGANKFVTYGNLVTDLAGAGAGTSNLTTGDTGDSLALTTIISGLSSVTSTNFTGSLLGTSSWATNAVTATTATNATNTAVTDTTSGTGPYYVTFVAGTTGNQAQLVDSTGLTYNATTNTLTVTASYATQALSASYATSVNNLTNAITNNTDNRVLTATGGGTINGEGNLTFDGTTLTVTGNEVITGNLTVQGTASFQQTTNLEVADRFVLFASGSNTAGDGGIVVQQATQNVGELFAYENAANRWGFTSSFNASSPSYTAAAFVTTTEVAAANPSAAPIYGGASNGFGNIHVNSSTGDIFIYS